MWKKIRSVWLVTILTITLFSTNIFACACCAEPGFYMDWTGKTDNFTHDLVKRIKFADKTEIYLTEAGWETISGLDPLKEKYPMESTQKLPFPFISSNTFTKDKWTINLQTSDKKAYATMVLPMPEEMTQFKVDIHDGKDGGLGSPLLYKEWRFSGKVKSGTGFVSDGLNDSTQYKLIFQGRGTGCDEVYDFTHWQLLVYGEKASYSLFGKLSSGRKTKQEK